jgi:hypothetical protein
MRRTPEYVVNEVTVPGSIRGTYRLARCRFHIPSVEQAGVTRPR